MKILKWFRNLFFSTTSENLEKKSVFDSIEDLPLWNWIKIHETQNLTYIYQLDSYRNLPKILPQKELINLEEIWLELNQQIFDGFGMSENYERYLNLVRREIETRSDMIINEDRFLQNEINIIQADISLLFNSKEKQTFDSVVVDLEKYMGFRLDPKKISVKNYYNYIQKVNTKAT